MSVTSLCLGIDISPRRLGWALAHLEDGTPVACGCDHVDLPDDCWHYRQMEHALGAVGVWLDRLSGEIHYVAIERPALPPKSGTNAAFNAGRAYQEAMSAIRRRWPWAVVDEFAPSEWRKWAGLKGNSSKFEVAQHASANGFLAHILAVRDGMQDAADAACIALAGVERNRQTLATPSGQAAL